MNPIRMQHPEHGFHHAYDSAELARMESNGWKREGKAPDKDAQIKALRDQLATLEGAVAPLEGVAPDEAPKAKPGRKPKADKA